MLSQLRSNIYPWRRSKFIPLCALLSFNQKKNLPSTPSQRWHMDIKDRKNAGRKVCAKLQSLEMQISLPQSITHTHTHTHTQSFSLSPPTALLPSKEPAKTQTQQECWCLQLMACFNSSLPWALLNFFSGVNPSWAEFPDPWRCSMQAAHFLTMLQSFREHILLFPHLWVQLKPWAWLLTRPLPPGSPAEIGDGGRGRTVLTKEGACAEELIKRKFPMAA